MGNSRLIGGALGFLAVAGLVAWSLWPRPVPLNESEYELTLALYRVCNQANEAGLANLESLFLEKQAAETIGRDSPIAVVIADAKAGRWKDATKACRTLMEDQTKD